MNQAFEYVSINGITTENNIPYEGIVKKCEYKESEEVFRNTGFNNVKTQSSISLQSAVSQQPVSIAIAASNFHFQFYKKGVFNGECGLKIDHGVLLVGYGIQDNNK